ncbi:MAG TPA: hypothetical protein PL182_05495 [Pseudobdellovibrionaceae bacterium]|nr:hypothetical protein [Pseudobdellovibrionaceae bacterium]
MKKTFMFAALLSMSPGMIYAQSSLENDLDSELSQISATRSGPQTAEGTPAAAVIAPQGTVGSGSQPIYILNQATPTSNAQVQQAQQAQVQKQPQVDIYGAPVQQSRAEAIREARQKAEIETENRIAEKLEQSRIEDEKRRAAQLFGNSMNQVSNNTVNAENVNVNQQQVQAVQYVPVVAAAKEEPKAEEPKENTRDIIREELRAALETEKETPVEMTEKRYFSAMAGINELPDASNVRGNYSFAASFGTIYDGAYAVEGTFGYSNYTVADIFGGGVYDPYYGVYIPREVDTDQFSGSLAMKYIFLDGMIKPMAGGLMQYSYRTFKWNDSFAPSNGSGDASSHAIDLGIVLGADIEFSKKFSLGFDFRYMWNMASRVNTGSNAGWFADSAYMGSKPIEKFQYYTMGVVGRVNF